MLLMGCKKPASLANLDRFLLNRQLHIYPRNWKKPRDEFQFAEERISAEVRVASLDLESNSSIWIQIRTQVVRTRVGRPPDDRKKTCGSQTTCDAWPSTQIKTRWPRVLTEIPQTQNFVCRRRALSHVCTSIKTQKKVKTLVLFYSCGFNCILIENTIWS